MAPPGRRRDAPTMFPSLTACILYLILLCSTPAFAASAVLGIDLGTEYIKATLVKPGIPLEIVLTKDSKRKETAAIAFKPAVRGSPDAGDFPERIYGSDAMALHTRFPGEVFPNLKGLLCIPSTPYIEIAALYHEKYPAVQVDNTGFGSAVGIRSNNFNATEPLFAVEELLAMQLQNVRHNAEIMAGKTQTIRNAVFTVPAFYTADERRAVTLAASLAGIEVMALISDGLAVGLNYAMPRTFPNIDKGEKPEHHLVYDMGAGSTTVTVLKFQAREVKDIGRFNKTVQEVSVVGTGWNSLLGGDLLNSYIIDDMLAKFLETPGAKKQNVQEADIRANGRAFAKLWREAEKLRQVLSANTAAAANFEELHAHIDFKYKLSRAEYEALTADNVALRVPEPIHEALNKAQLKITDIDSVVLHGGTVRTPFIQRVLESELGDAAKLKTNVNADEAAAFGAGFKAAGLSPSFRVKEIRDSDSAVYGVNLKWEYYNKERSQKIFQPTSQTGTVKHMSFKNLDDFELTFVQDVPTAEGNGRPVSKVQFNNLTASVAELTDKYGCKRVNITNTVSFRLDPASGLPEVISASVSCEVEPEKKGSIADGVKNLFGFGGKKDQEVLDEEAVVLEASSSSSSDSTSAAKSTSKAKDSKKDAKKDPKEDSKNTKKDAKKDEPKKEIKTIRVSFTTTPLGLPMPSESELQQIISRLDAFDKADENRVTRAETFNSLEAFTYRARDLLTDKSFIGASTASQRDEISKLLHATSEWLSDEGAQAGLDVVKTKLNDLKDLVKPITSRQEEASKRPQQIQNLNDALNRTQGLIDTIRAQIAEAAEAASSSSLEAGKSSTESTSTETSTPTGSSSSDGFLDLEDEPYPTEESESSSSSTFSFSHPTFPPIPTPSFTPYTEADLTDIVSTYDAISAWLKEKTGEQEALAASEDPVLLSSDLVSKTSQLNKATTELMQKRFKLPPKPKTTKSKTSKTKSKKSKKGQASESSATASVEDDVAGSSTVVEEATATPEVGESAATPPEHGEL